MKLIRPINNSWLSLRLLALLVPLCLAYPSYSSEVISTTVTTEPVSTTEEITNSTTTTSSEVVGTEVNTAGGIQTTTTTTEITTTVVDEVTTTTILNQTTTTVTEETTQTTEDKQSTNYLTNPDFSNGGTGWSISGQSTTNGTLATGNQSGGGTTATQTVDLFDQMTQSEINNGFDIKYGADVISHPSNTSVPLCNSTSSVDCKDDFSITFTIADTAGNILHKFEHEYTGINFSGSQPFFFTQTIDPNNYTSALGTLELYGIDRGFYSGTFGPQFDNALVQTYWSVVNFITEQITTQVTEQITNVVIDYVTTTTVTQEVTSEDVFVGDPVQDTIQTVQETTTEPEAPRVETQPVREFTVEVQTPGGGPSQTMNIEVKTDSKGEMTVEIKPDTKEPEQQQETKQEVAKADAKIEKEIKQQEQKSESKQESKQEMKQKIAQAVIGKIVDQLGTDAASQGTQLALMDKLGADITQQQATLLDNTTWYQDKAVYSGLDVVDNPQGRFFSLAQDATMDQLIGSQYK